MLVVGQAETFGTDVPPVIEREAQERVERYAAEAAATGASSARSAEVPGDGWFCAPAVAHELPAGLAGARARRSSGRCSPSSAVASVEQALERVERAPFALTGGRVLAQPGDRRGGQAAGPRSGTST